MSNAVAPTLSICIPIYNFAKFIPETLDSIFANAGVDDVEVIVTDGASTDDTPAIMALYLAKHRNLRYFRLPKKGGIDRDMATSVDPATGDYVWLFSGDDWMLPGAIEKAKARIASGLDLYVCQHRETLVDKSLTDWPVMKDGLEATWKLSDTTQRHAYFANAVNTEAFFSFMGNLIIKRSTWHAMPLDERFVGTCFAHSARLMALMKGGLTIQFIPEAWLRRRPDNDSFMSGGMVKRFAIGIEGYRKISDALFGHESVEALHVRRAVRHEFGLWMLVYGKYMTWLNPETESRKQMDALVRTAYCEPTWDNFVVRLKYRLTSIKKFRQSHKDICAKHEALRGSQFPLFGS